MTNQDILARLQAIVTDWKGQSVELTPETRLSDGVVEDSVELMELVLCIEDGFGIEISDAVLDHLETVEDVIIYIKDTI